MTTPRFTLQTYSRWLREVRDVTQPHARFGGMLTETGGSTMRNAHFYMLAALDAFQATSFVETGTNTGRTVTIIGQYFSGPIHTCELSEGLYQTASANVKAFNLPHVTMHCGDSVETLERLIASGTLGDRPFFFLDAHPPVSEVGAHWPLSDELRLIARLPRWVTIIDDFPHAGFHSHIPQARHHLNAHHVNEGLRDISDWHWWFPQYPEREKMPTDQRVGQVLVCRGFDPEVGIALNRSMRPPLADDERLAGRLIDVTCDFDPRGAVFASPAVDVSAAAHEHSSTTRVSQGDAHSSDARREASLAVGTDYDRWADHSNLEAAWNERARVVAATFIPAGARVLDIGCGAMALERFLPLGCTYQPCDVLARDARTRVVDLNAGEMPSFEDVDIVTMLGVFEYIHDLPAFLRRLRAAQLPVIATYCSTDLTTHLDRASLGWVNHLSTREVLVSLVEAGFHVQAATRLDDLQMVMSLRPHSPIRVQDRRVLVVTQGAVASSAAYGRSLGERFGLHALQSVLPPHASVSVIDVGQRVPEGPFDLAVVGLGGGLRMGVARELLPYLEAAPKALGVFGAPSSPDAALGELLDRLTVWLARSEHDATRFGAGRGNVVPLGAWALDAIPMAKGVDVTPFDADAWMADRAATALALDRLVQKVQSHTLVASSRLHPLLCALTSAEYVCVPEGRVDDATFAAIDAVARDVLGRSLARGQWVEVDPDVVAAYKRKLRLLMAETRNLVGMLIDAPTAAAPVS